MPQYKLHHFKSLTSTQDKAREFAKKGLSDVVVIADVQTKGRGRLKREWHSDRGGLWMSILLRPKNIGNLQYLTFIAAVSVAKSIKKITNLDAKIKWPNDLHYKKRKMCGILTEGIFGKTNYVSVGIGLNVNQDNFPSEVKNIATSLNIIRKNKFDINKIAKNVLREFYALYNNLYKQDKLNQIKKIWKRYCDTIGKNVIVITKNKKFKGRAVGIDENCSLLLKTKNNQIIKIIEGDIKVRY